MSSSDLTSALSPVVDAPEKLALRYCIGGSVASSVFGVPRATLDVNLVCDLRLNQVDAFVSLLKGDYYIDADMIRDAIRRRASFNLIHLATMLKVYFEELTGDFMFLSWAVAPDHIAQVRGFVKPPPPPPPPPPPN